MTDRIKINHDGDTTLAFFWCHGCDCRHHVVLEPKESAWGWNGSMDKPTFTPSVLTWSGDAKNTRCHSFVTDGRMQYLADCEHNLAGQTVELPAREYWLFDSDERGICAGCGSEGTQDHVRALWICDNPECDGTVD